MLKAAIENGVSDDVNDRIAIMNRHGRRLVVGNGWLPKREILTGVGPNTVSQPRVRDRRSADDLETYTPCILPKSLRKQKSIEELISWLYPQGHQQQ